MINKLNKLSDDFTKFKNTIDDIIIMNTTLVQEIANQINTKMDILCNLENNNQSNNKQTIKKTKALTKLAFFKDQLKININKFLNVLYTEDDIKEIEDNAEYKSKLKEPAKTNKKIDLLYTLVTKNPDKNKKLKELFDEYKNNTDNIYNDEETKSEE